MSSLLCRAPTLDLALSPLPEAHGEDSEDGEEDGVDRDADCDIDKDVEEEEKASDIDEEERSILMEEEVTNEARAFRSDIKEALLKERKKWSSEAGKDFVKGLKLWEDLKPRRVQALCAFEAGAVMDGARPAAWLQDGWLEATLDGRDGLVF